MAISTTNYKHCTLVKMDGRVDSETGDSLMKAFEKIQEEGVYKLVFDMSDVTFFSSKGWWVLIQAQKACKRYNRGELVLANVPDKIKEALDLVGLEHYFQVYDDVVGAVGSF